MRSHCERELSQDTSVVWVAEERGNLVSVVWVKVMEKVPWPDPFTASWAYVTNVYTRPSHRGRGTGTRLLTRVQEWARSQPGLEFLVLWPSDGSVDWYRRQGFHKTEALVWKTGD